MRMNGQRFWDPLSRVVGMLCCALLSGTLLSAAADKADRGLPETKSREAVPNPLSLHAAFVLAVGHNTGVRAAALAAGANSRRVLAAKGQFDATLFADTGWNNTDTPDIDNPGHAVRYSSGHLTAGARKRFVTGTETDLSTALDYTDNPTDSTVLDPVYNSALSLTLRQDLLRDAGSDINRTDILTAEDNWSISRENLRETTIQTLYNVEAAYWALYFAKSDLTVRRAQLDRANRLVQVAEAQVRVGEAAPIDITRARSSAAAQQVAILTAEDNVALQRNRLLRLLGVANPDESLREIKLADDPGGTVDVGSLQTSVDIAWQERPDCRQADLLLHIAKLHERYTRNQRLPSLQVYGSLGLAGVDDSAGGAGRDISGAHYPAWGVGVSVQIPISNRTANGNFEAAALERRRAATLRRGVLEQALQEVADAFDQLKTAAKQIHTAQQSQQLAQKLMTAEERSFNLGRSNSLDVLTAQASLATAQRDVVNARTTYATSLAYLYSVRGDLLKRKGFRPPQ